MFRRDLSRLRAIAFDLDNTLWEVEPVIARAEHRVMDWLSEHCPRIAQRFTNEQLRAARRQLALDEPHRAYDFTYLRIESLARYARECGYDEVIAERAFEVFFAARNELELYADVRPALERLRSRYTLASLTNGNADLRRIGLAPMFAVSLSSGEVGSAKPQRGGFDELAARLKAQPHEVLYVGDDPVIDVEGARAAGMRTAWVNRCGMPWPEAVVKADIVVTDCTELASRLGV